MQTKLLIGADIVPTASNFKEFKEGNINALLGEKLTDLLKDIDFTMFNLEVPLTNKVTLLQKCGPNLVAPIETINGLKKINPYFFTLANNHILDQEEQGIQSTIETLTKENIKYAGAGKNLEEASKPFIFEKNNIRVGIYCCAENEFSIATENTAGANPFDPLVSLEHIKNLKNEVDYVIVLYHGGKEHYRYPSPYLQKVCRRMIDCGANLVVCQHSHCIGCEENWKEGKIVYGQGNFIFDDSDSEFWKTSLLIEIDFKSRKECTIKYIPVIKKENMIRMADKEDGENILSDFEKRSNQIKQKGFVEKEYATFAQQHINYYLRIGIPYNNSLFYKVLNKLSKGTWFIKCVKKEQKLALCNYLECEAHRELFIQGLKNNITCHGR